MMISGTAEAGARWPLPFSALRWDGSSGAGAGASGGFTVSPRRLAGATTLLLATSASNKRLKPMRSSMGSAVGREPSPVYHTESVASGRNDEPRQVPMKWLSLRRRDLGDKLRQGAAWRLLPGHGEGEFAVADAHGKALGETRRRLLAIGRDEFGKSGEQASLCQTVPVDAVDARFGPGRVEVAERSPFLLMVRSLPRNLDRLRWYAHVDSGAAGAWGTFARGARPPRRNGRNG